MINIPTIGNFIDSDSACAPHSEGDGSYSGGSEPSPEPLPIGQRGAGSQPRLVIGASSPSKGQKAEGAAAGPVGPIGYQGGQMSRHPSPVTAGADPDSCSRFLFIDGIPMRTTSHCHASSQQKHSYCEIHHTIWAWPIASSGSRWRACPGSTRCRRPSAAA